MEKGKMQRTWVRILLTALTLAVMVLIFFFSTETAEESDETSGVFTQQMIEMLYPDFDSYSTEEQMTLYESLQYGIRKTAHFTEYAILGFLLRLCIESWFGKRGWLLQAAWLGGTLYAVTDELHQLTTDGRSGQWTDVLIDSSGVICGVLVAILILRIVHKRKVSGGD